MSLQRWAARRDANESSIVSALRAAGAEVWPISGTGAPDLLVRFRRRLYAFEVKGLKGRRTLAQGLSEWPLLRSVEEALQAIGVVDDLT